MGVIKKVLHMNVGDGETSYANNSGLQKVVMSKTLPVLNTTLEDMCNNHIGFEKCFKMVDLGCSSGPNTLLATSHIINTIEGLCTQKNIKDLPEFEVFLNDLPGNDFNNLFNLLPNLHQNGKQRGNCYIYGLPGSFYGRLLPRNSIHFAYSSYSLHWLSQVPEGLENKNKENIHMAMTSPREVYEAYAKQFQTDFFRFLSARADEIISGGRMVVTFIGRSVEDPSTKDDLALFTMVAKTLADLVAEGLVKMDDLYTFNIPIYTPCIQEVDTAIQNEGSFTLDKLEISRVRWDANDNIDDNQYDHNKSGKIVADCVRAFMEPMLATHFGNWIVNDLFERYAKRVAEHLSMEQPEYFNIVISLSRK